MADNIKRDALGLVFIDQLEETSRPSSMLLADALWIADMRREMKYKHWSAEQRKVFELALKWWYEAHNLKVPDDLL